MNLFDLFAKISLDTSEYERGIDQAQKKFKDFSSNIKGLSESISKVYSGLGDMFKPVLDGFKAVESVGSKAANVVTTGFKALAGVSTAVAGGAAAIGKSAFDAYANYEQLVGGIETLFKSSAGTVMQYADNAYKTAGMSANNYMETVTGFSASLLQGLGGDTDAAAKIANMAITDMSDNANKMGTAIGSIQYAYQGFAKQNYTMLDNLKLGYGGTQEEMYRLLQHAAELNDEFAKTADFSINSKGHVEAEFADIIKAIHIVQEEMGITGTTAKEASSTIQGSVSSMKGAWENLMVGIADSNQDLSGLMDKLIESVVIVGNNVVPRVKEIVETIIRAAPEFVRGFAEIIPQFAPMGIEIVQMLAEGIGSQIPKLLEFGGQAIGAIADGIVKYAPNIQTAIVGLITGIGNMIGGQSDKLVSAGETIIDGIFSVFETAGDVISQHIGDFIPLITDAFLSYHEALFTVGLNILGAIGQGIIENKDEIQSIASEAIANMVTSLRDNAPAIIEGGIALLEALVGAIRENLPLILATGAEIIGQLVAGISTASTEVGAIISVAVLPHIQKIIETVGEIREVVGKVVDFVTGGKGIGKIISIGSKLKVGIKALFSLIMAHPVVTVITGIIAAVTLLWTHCEGFRNAVKAIMEAVGNFFVAAWETIKNAWNAAGEFFGGVVEAIKGVFEGIGEFLSGLFSAAWEAIKAVWSGVVEFFAGVWEGIKGVFSVVADVLGGFFSTAWEVIKLIWGAAAAFFEGVWQGIQASAEGFGLALTAIFELTWKSIEAIWNLAVSFFSEVWEGIKAVFSVVEEVLGGFFSAAWEAVKEAWSEAKNFFADLWNNIKSKAQEAAEDIKNKLKAAWEAIKSVWSTAKSFFEGLWNSIKSTAAAAAESVKRALSEAWNAIKSAWNAAPGFFSGIRSKILGVFSGIGSKFMQIGSSIVSGIKSGVSNAPMSLS